MTVTNPVGAAEAASANGIGLPVKDATSRMHMATLAEHVAEGGSIAGWARGADVAVSTAQALWRRICRDLGPQAS